MSGNSVAMIVTAVSKRFTANSSAGYKERMTTMLEILHVRHPRSNRKKVFETRDLRLWVRPQGTWSGPVVRAKLELERSSPEGKPSKWRIIWSCLLRIMNNEVEIKHRRPR